MHTENRIYEGMLVRDADGIALGKVVALGRERFLIEKGSFLLREYSAPYTEVRAVEGTEVRLASTVDSLAQGAVPASAAGRSAGGTLNDFPWPQDEEEETLPGLPLSELPPGLQLDDDEEDEVTQKVHRSRVGDRSDTEELESSPYHAASVSTDEPVDGPDIDVHRRF